jgi:hypothetical protein
LRPGTSGHLTACNLLALRQSTLPAWIIGFQSYSLLEQLPREVLDSIVTCPAGLRACLWGRISSARRIPTVPTSAGSEEVVRADFRALASFAVSGATSFRSGASG